VGKRLGSNGSESDAIKIAYYKEKEKQNMIFLATIFVCLGIGTVFNEAGVGLVAGVALGSLWITSTVQAAKGSDSLIRKDKMIVRIAALYALALIAVYLFTIEYQSLYTSPLLLVLIGVVLLGVFFARSHLSEAARSQERDASIKVRYYIKAEKRDVLFLAFLFIGIGGGAFFSLPASGLILGIALGIYASKFYLGLNGPEELEQALPGNTSVHMAILLLLYAFAFVVSIIVQTNVPPYSYETSLILILIGVAMLAIFADRTILGR
jgi:hypothetical protein